MPPALHPAIVLRKTVNPRSLVGQRQTIYLVELWETILWLVLIGIAAGSDRPGRSSHPGVLALLLLLTFLDLWTLGRYWLIDTEPIRPLAEQSPVLARLAQERRGTRIASNLGNLPILVGTAPVSAYRTMNLPALESLTQLAQQPIIGTHEPTVRVRCGRPGRGCGSSTPWRAGSPDGGRGPSSPASRSTIPLWRVGFTGRLGPRSRGTG